MPVSRRLRYEVLRRDNYACRYCGAGAPDVKLTVDHVIPVTLGGSDEPQNLITACEPCNNGKSSTSPDAPLVDDVAADALRWGHAMREAADMLLREHAERTRLQDYFLERWQTWSYGPRHEHFPLPAGWQASTDAMLAAGLPLEILCECIDLAMTRKHVSDPFRYMCGIAWRKVGELREIASALVDADDSRDMSAESPDASCDLADLTVDQALRLWTHVPPDDPLRDEALTRRVEAIRRQIGGHD